MPLTGKCPIRCWSYTSSFTLALLNLALWPHWPSAFAVTLLLPTSGHLHMLSISSRGHFYSPSLKCLFLRETLPDLPDGVTPLSCAPHFPTNSTHPSFELYTFILFKKFFFEYLFLRERDRQTDRVRAREGQRKRETQNPKQAPGSELSAQSPTRGSNPRTMRS